MYIFIRSDFMKKFLTMVLAILLTINIFAPCNALASTSVSEPKQFTQTDNYDREFFYLVGFMNSNFNAYKEYMKSWPRERGYTKRDPGKSPVIIPGSSRVHKTPPISSN
jgi:hypothetical protein